MASTLISARAVRPSGAVSAQAFSAPRRGLRAAAARPVPAAASLSGLRSIAPNAPALGSPRLDATPSARGRVGAGAIVAEAAEAEVGPMKVVFYSARPYVKSSFGPVIRAKYQTRFLDYRLDVTTAELLREGERAVCIFVNDDCSAPVIDVLAEKGVEIIALRCAGFDNVDVAHAEKRGIQVVRVPRYSPDSIAEHAVALMLTLNRWIHLAWTRTRSMNFTLSGLSGFEMKGRTAGVVGTGEIGRCTARILLGFKMNVVASDPFPNQELIDDGVTYMDLDEMLPICDIITLHAPLMPQTFHMINRERVEKFKKGVMVINTSRGGLVDTDALVWGLEQGIIGAAGLDVYESEATFFFQDYSSLTRLEKLEARKRIWDRRFAELMSFPAVIVTPHSAFLTEEALENMATTTLESLTEYLESGSVESYTRVKPPKEAPKEVKEAKA